MHFTVFGCLNSFAFLVAAASTVFLARDRAALTRAIAGLLISSVLVGYAVSYSSKWLLYHTALGLEETISEGTHFYGTAIGASFAGWAYSRWVKLDYRMLVDAAYPGVLLGSSIGRVGCWVAGCCGGCDLWIPVQLCSSLGDFLGYLFVVLVVRRTAARAGSTAVAAVCWYAGVRFCLEFVRDEPRILLGATLAQLLALFTGSFAITIHFVAVRRGPPLPITGTGCGGESMASPLMGEQ